MWKVRGRRKRRKCGNLEGELEYDRNRCIMNQMNVNEYKIIKKL